MRLGLFGYITLILLATIARAEAPVAPVVHKDTGWAIAAPADWGKFPVGDRVALYLVGDFRAGVPLMDGILSAVKAGLTVEVFAAGRSVDEQLQIDLKELKESGAFSPLQEPTIEEFTLGDGTKAKLLKTEFIRKLNGRLSIQAKAYCLDLQGQRIVVTGFITCSHPGRIYLDKIGLPAFVEAHVRSLVLDPDKLDLKQLQTAYDNHNWQAVNVLDRARQGNDLLAGEKYSEAIDAFRKAIQECNELPVAHNGLSWALLQLKDPKVLEEALREATLAVEQTSQLDIAALDTLAHAHFQNGDKTRAIETIEKALKLAPGNADLKTSLDKFKQ